MAPHWFHILLSLADRHLHGLAITKDVLERTGGEVHLWPGMLYGALKKLTEAGWVAEVAPPADAAPAGGRPRYFGITPAGRRACAKEAERLAGLVDVARHKKLLRSTR